MKIEECVCHLCDSTFNLKNNLERRKRAAYTKDDSPRQKCGDCNEIFCTEKLLKRHINVEHIGLACEKCGEKFTLKSSLEVHIGNRIELVCSECEAVFCNLPSLMKHKNKIHKHMLNVMYAMKVIKKIV